MNNIIFELEEILRVLKQSKLSEKDAFEYVQKRLQLKDRYNKIDKDKKPY